MVPGNTGEQQYEYIISKLVSRDTIFSKYSQNNPIINLRAYPNSNLIRVGHKAPGFDDRWAPVVLETGYVTKSQRKCLKSIDLPAITLFHKILESKAIGYLGNFGIKADIESIAITNREIEADSYSLEEGLLTIRNIHIAEPNGTITMIALELLKEDYPNRAIVFQGTIFWEDDTQDTVLYSIPLYSSSIEQGLSIILKEAAEKVLQKR